MFPRGERHIGRNECSLAEMRFQNRPHALPEDSANQNVRIQNNGFSGEPSEYAVLA